MSNLATDQLYAEQKWVTSYLKTARNEADKESTAMQKFLTENVLTLLQQVDTSLQDQTKTFDTLQQSINIVFNSILSDRNEFINRQRKMMLTTSSKLKAFSQLQAECFTRFSRVEILIENHTDLDDRLLSIVNHTQIKFRNLEPKM